MTGEVIEVCQLCGHVIDPVEVTAPWGDRYRITLCGRAECCADRAVRESIERSRREAAERVERDFLAYRLRAGFVPVVTDPKAWLRITGI